MSSQTKKKKPLVAFPWFGGKFYHLSWLLPLLPPCDHYCEPFGGSAVVLLNRPVSRIETYNDIYSELSHFFKTLREHRDELLELLRLTPYSREEYELSISSENGAGDVERARRFVIQTCFSINSVHARNNKNAWSYSVNPAAKEYNKNCSNQPSVKFRSTIRRLPAIVERLGLVQFECRPAIEVVKRFDSGATFFYCDPPYVHCTRRDYLSGRANTRPAYENEMENEDHRELAEVLHNIEGRAAISGYACDLYDKELYADWNRFEAPPRKNASSGKIAQEILWTNYKPSMYGPLFKE